jgi:E3 ubiquitin-protein ligase TRIP12
MPSSRSFVPVVTSRVLCCVTLVTLVCQVAFCFSLLCQVRVSRKRILESAMKVMETYASHKAQLEVEYYGEAGIGLGPTLEFYSLTSLEILRPSHNLWICDSTSGPDTALLEGLSSKYPHGLYPLPFASSLDKKTREQRLEVYRFTGRFIAKAIADHRLLDLPFSVVFYKQLLGQPLSLDDLCLLNPQMGKTVLRLHSIATRCDDILSDAGLSEAQRKQRLSALTLDGCKIEDLCLNFTVPAYADIELKHGGRDLAVTLENLSEYIACLTSSLLAEGVDPAMRAIWEGFSEVSDPAKLRIFAVDELDELLTGSASPWTYQCTSHLPVLP